MSDPFTLRMMTLADLLQVSQIDELSFSLPWSKSTYLYEILENESSHLVVLAAPDSLAPRTETEAQTEVASSTSPLSGVQRLIRRLGLFPVRPLPPPTSDLIVGMSGFWCAVGEAHISTIAVHPDWRGRSLGEVLLTCVLKRGIDLGATESVLEVRVSNQVAINLYRKYEFRVLSRRRRYYRDNNEDAWLMQADLSEGYRARLVERMEALQARVPFVDGVNGNPA